MIDELDVILDETGVVYKILFSPWRHIIVTEVLRGFLELKPCDERRLLSEHQDSSLSRVFCFVATLSEELSS
jgi:hypothetical protein